MLVLIAVSVKISAVPVLPSDKIARDKRPPALACVFLPVAIYPDAIRIPLLNALAVTSYSTAE